MISYDKFFKRLEMKLGEIVDIVSGYAYKAKVPEKEGSDIYTLQIRDINDGYFNYESMLCVEDLNYKNHYFYKQDDVLLIGKGLDFKAYLPKNVDIKKKIVIANPIYILRCKKTILPQYLHIYLIQSQIQKMLLSISTGGRIKTLPKSNLLELDVITPSLEEQKKVIKIFDLIEKQKYIASQIISQRENQLNEHIFSNGDSK